MPNYRAPPATPAPSAQPANIDHANAPPVKLPHGQLHSRSSIERFARAGRLLARQDSKAADPVTLGQMLGHLGAVQVQLPTPNGAAQTLDEALSLLRPALGDQSLAVKEALKLRG